LGRRGLPTRKELTEVSPGRRRSARPGGRDFRTTRGTKTPKPARVCCACGETLIVKGLERGKCGWGDFTNEQREHISEISKAARSMDAPDGHLLRPAYRGGAPGKSKMRVNKE